jgi:hypothetical protein
MGGFFLFVSVCIIKNATSFEQQFLYGLFSNCNNHTIIYQFVNLFISFICYLSLDLLIYLFICLLFNYWFLFVYIYCINSLIPNEVFIFVLSVISFFSLLIAFVDPLTLKQRLQPASRFYQITIFVSFNIVVHLESFCNVIN